MDQVFRILLSVTKALLFILLLCHLNCQGMPPKKSTGVCKLLISEINVDNPGGDNLKVFLELQEVCTVPHKGRKRNPTTILHGYKLLVIRGIDSTIVLALDLDKLSVREGHDGHIFVLGSHLVPNVDFDLNHDSLQSIYKNPEQKNLLPVGDDSPYGVVLLHHTSQKELKDLKLYMSPDGKYLPTPITNYEDLLIKQNAVDLVVWGRTVSTNRCTVFEGIWPQGQVLDESRKYLLRDIDASDPTNQVDFSLNRCTAMTDGFLPEAFQYDVPSPGVVNPCKGFYFFVEDVIDKISYLAKSQQPNPKIMEQCQSISDVPQQESMVIDEVAVSSELVSRAAATSSSNCPLEFGPVAQTANLEMQISMTEDLIARKHSETPGLPPHNPLSNTFNPQWITKAKEHLPDDAAVLRRPEVQEWITVNDGTNGWPLSFSCAVCRHIFEEGARADVKRKTAIQTPQGYYSKKPFKNEYVILDHMDDQVHLSSMSIKKQLQLVQTKNEFEKLVEDSMELEMLPTVNMVRTVYSETLAEIPFNKHKYLVELQKANGLDLGIHHYHKTAAKDITELISSTFHDTLIRHLIQYDKPFSLLVDSTTDTRNIPYLICYIQTIEGAYPQTYFYRLIELPKGESAKETFDSFWRSVEEDDVNFGSFKAFFIRRIAAFSSDGANVMIGKKHSFHTLLVDKIQRKIPAVQCMAHKVALSLRRAILKSKDPQMKYFQVFEKTFNQFYNFYMSRGSKRWQHLSDLASELGLGIRRIKYFFEVRWASSEYEVLYSLWKDLLPLQLDLMSISMDSNFNKKAQSTARELYEIVSDKTWVLVMHESLDFLTIYKQLSLSLQADSAMLAGKAGTLQRAYDAFELLKTKPGEFASNFLQKVTCLNVCKKGECTMEQYENCDHLVTEGGLVLTDNQKSNFKLYKARYNLYENLQKELQFYFNFEELDAFEIFNQKSFVIPCSTPEVQVPSKAPTFSTLFDKLNYQNIKLKEIFEGPNSDDDNSDGFIGFRVAEQLVLPVIDAVSEPKHDEVDDKRFAIICKFYFIEKEECNELRKDFITLKSQLTDSYFFSHNLQSEMTVFWPLVLKNFGNELTITSRLQLLIERMLCTPFGTSICERGFSYLTRIKSNSRAGLSPDHIQDIIRIIINGPHDLKSFDAEKVAKHFVKKFVRVDDENFQGGRIPKQNLRFRPTSRLF